MENVLRIIDANFNRAREALRVIEDGIRFCYGENRDLIGKLKKIRHSLSEGVEKNFGFAELKKERDSCGDAGREIDSRDKATIRQIVERNFMRAEEAMRTLEEYSKTTSPEASLLFHNLRFELYGAEKETSLFLDRHGEKN